MAVSESLKKAKKKYRKKVTNLSIGLTPKDSDVVEHLNKQDNKTAYIVSLIRKDMKHD